MFNDLDSDQLKVLLTDIVMSSGDVNFRFRFHKFARRNDESIRHLFGIVGPGQAIVFMVPDVDRFYKEFENRLALIIYIRITRQTDLTKIPLGSYGRLPSSRFVLADSLDEFAMNVVIDLAKLVNRLSGTVDTDDIRTIIRNARGTSPTSSSLEVHQQGEHDLQIETLMDMDLTVDELEHVISLENDSNASALIGSWFDSKRQVALTVAEAIWPEPSVFIGDVTIVGTAHGIFYGNVEMSAVAS